MRQATTFFVLFFIVQVCTIKNVFSQKSDTSKKFAFPLINKYGKELDDFSAKNWDITDIKVGDLNKDNIDDFALVLEYKDSIKIEDGYKFPRALLIVFKIGDHYELKLQHNTLIEHEKIAGLGGSDGWEGDTFDSMEIVNGVLKLHFKWDIRGVITLTQYVTRYQTNDFYLIAATCTSGYRTNEKKLDFNFSAKRYTIDEIDDETGFVEFHKKGKLPSNTLKKLIDIKDPDNENIPGFTNIY